MKAVKSAIAVFLVGASIGSGYLAYDTHKELKSAIKTINSLEQKVIVQDEKVELLKNDKALLTDKYNKMIEKYDDLKGKHDILKGDYDQSLIDNEKLQKRINDISKNYINVSASAYIAKCVEGCTGITASGEDVTDSIYYNGMRVIATDTRVIPMYSVVELNFKDGTKEKAIALDTGGGIKGNKIDLLVNSTDRAMNFGRQKVTVRVLKWGA